MKNLQAEEYKSFLKIRNNCNRTSESIADLFIISQTEDKLKKDKIYGFSKTISMHNEIARKVRKTAENIELMKADDLSDQVKLKIPKNKKKKLKLDE